MRRGQVPTEFHFQAHQSLLTREKSWGDRFYGEWGLASRRVPNRGHSWGGESLGGGKKGDSLMRAGGEAASRPAKELEWFPQSEGGEKKIRATLKGKREGLG